jgi:hypothetical protein
MGLRVPAENKTRLSNLRSCEVVFWAQPQITATASGDVILLAWMLESAGLALSRNCSTIFLLQQLVGLGNAEIVSHAAEVRQSLVLFNIDAFEDDRVAAHPDVE